MWQLERNSALTDVAPAPPTALSGIYAGAAMIAARDVRYEVGGRQILDGAMLSVEPNECVALVGPSGSGKTTLINVLAGIITPQHGSVSVAGAELTTLNGGRRADHRRRYVGLVFQFGELLVELNVIENVALPLQLSGDLARRQALEVARSQLRSVGMEQLADESVDNLSGGEVQRVGIARALVASPSVLLADEPTGNLDEDNAHQVTTLLVEQSHRSGAAAVIATHDPAVAAMCDRVVRLVHGELRNVTR